MGLADGIAWENEHGIIDKYSIPKIIKISIEDFGSVVCVYFVIGSYDECRSLLHHIRNFDLTLYEILHLLDSQDNKEYWKEKVFIFSKHERHVDSGRYILKCCFENKKDEISNGGSKMETKDFNVIIEKQMETCKDVLINKAKEYATEDRLHNFKVAAELQNCTPKQALAGFMAKHTVSVYDMCRSNEVFSIPQWSEKITDHINYLLILRALVEEERQNGFMKNDNKSDSDMNQKEHDSMTLECVIENLSKEEAILISDKIAEMLKKHDVEVTTEIEGK